MVEQKLLLNWNDVGDFVSSAFIGVFQLNVCVEADKRWFGLVNGHMAVSCCPDKETAKLLTECAALAQARDLVAALTQPQDAEGKGL